MEAIRNNMLGMGGYDDRERRLIDGLQQLQRSGITYQSIADEITASGCKLSRSVVSQFANRSSHLKPVYLDAIEAYLAAHDTQREPDAVGRTSQAYETSVGLYKTKAFDLGFGWLQAIWRMRAMGVLTGYPGVGKTTLLREYVKQAPGAIYVDCWPTMRLGDVLDVIAADLGITLRGTMHRRCMAVDAALRQRRDVMLLFDEAENLVGWSVKNIEVLRKLWDDTHTPVVLCGTGRLKKLLTQEHLAQLYSRNLAGEIGDIGIDEVGEILGRFDMTAGARNALIELARDTRHGGLRSLVKRLELCLMLADGRQIDEAIVDGTRPYQLAYGR